MGFVARTIFWLGLVYSAMPLDFGSLFADPVPRVADADPLAACASGVTEDCRRRIGDLRKALDTAAALGIVDRVSAWAETPPRADPPSPPRKPR
jgi:hypothetical protein